MEDMSWGESMHYLRICFTRDHVLGVDILQEDVFCWRTCLIGVHVLWEGMYHGRICLRGCHVLENVVSGVEISYRRSYFMEGYVLMGMVVFLW